MRKVQKINSLNKQCTAYMISKMFLKFVHCFFINTEVFIININVTVIYVIEII